MAEPQSDTPRRPLWWLELLLMLALYLVYTAIRNQFGSDLGDAAKQAAIDNAYQMIELERSIHLFGEFGIQDLFIGSDWFIRFWNIFYGFMHFVATIGAMLFLYLRHPERYVKWRSVIAATTTLALVGFAAYPLMPPRLLNDCGQYGACDPNYHFVDTLIDPGGLWSFDSDTMQSISNQYAAMPSLHIAWAIWVLVATYSVLRRRAARVAVASYPILTLFAIIVTGNHYWIDAVGGAMVLGVGYVVGLRIARWLPGIPASLGNGESHEDHPRPRSRNIDAARSPHRTR